MTEVISFKAAISESKDCSKRHLLLGNGFSIACRPDIFHYGSLYEQADFSAVPKLKSAFEALGTQDFELVVRNLEAGAKLIPIYATEDATAAAEMASDADKLKSILIDTIAKNHPDVPDAIPIDQFAACRRFLAHFIGPTAKGQVFTLNYDLLLYWTLMRDDIPFEEKTNLNANDGFGNDETDPDAEYVVWQGEVGAHNASVHFLHGALHLFDAGNELQKFTWIRTSERLVDQAREAVASDKFPIFVAEGSSQQKKTKLRHNAYLYQGYKQLTANAQQGQHCFFIHGHSLAKNDDHILMRLAKGRFKKMFVSLHGSPSTEANQEIISRAKNMAALRLAKWPLEVAFYDAETAAVWG